MKINKLQAFQLSDPVVDMDAMTVNFKIQAEVVNMADQAIVDAVVAEAQKLGITELYLLDKKFIGEAIKEKLDREREVTDE